MMRAQPCKIWVCVGLLVGLMTARVSYAEAAKQPNILFLFADDHTYEAVREFGHLDLDTPNLDRLARQGTTFTHAYNMGSWSPAVCIASRAMLVTGRTVWRAQSVHGQMNQEREQGRLWPQFMSQAGYQTFMTGKWHIPTNAARAFDITGTVRAGMPKDMPSHYERPAKDQSDTWSPYDKSLGGFWEGGTHWSEVVANEAIDFLAASRVKAQPFFMYVAFNAPHDPRQSPKEFVDRYPLERVLLPKNFLPLYPYQDSIGCGPSLRDERLAPFPRTEHAVKVHRQEYFALISHMDSQIGRILDELQRSGEADNTWIFFTADHGLAVGHHGLFGKQNMYDHSVRVPFLVVGPGAKAGHTVDQAIYLQDVMPTTLELAGFAKPSHVEFHSVLPLLSADTKTAHRDMIYGAYLQYQRAVIHDDWKLICYPEAKTFKLFHLSKDPLEINDLGHDPAHQSRRRDLFQRLQSLQQELADPLDLTALQTLL